MFYFELLDSQFRPTQQLYKNLEAGIYKLERHSNSLAFVSNRVWREADGEVSRLKGDRGVDLTEFTFIKLKAKAL